MKKLHLLKVMPLLVLALLLSACGALEAGSWPGIRADVDSGVAYVAHNQRVYAIDLATGAETWHFPAESGGFISHAQPELGPDGSLLVSGYDHVLYSLNAANGTQQWAFSGATNRYVAPALAANGLVYAPNADHKLYALNEAGNLQWSFTTGEPIWGQPVSDGQAVYIASMDHMLYALDAQTGAELWSLDLGGTTAGKPLLNADGMLFVGTLAQRVLAVNTASGQVAWSADTAGWVWGEATQVDDLLVVGDLEGNLYALNASTGNEAWRGQTNGAITGAPTLFGDDLYVVTEAGSLYAFSLDGRSRQVALPVDNAGELYGTPVAAGDLLLIGLTGGDSLVLALDNNGSLVWSFTPES